MVHHPHYCPYEPQPDGRFRCPRCGDIARRPTLRLCDARDPAARPPLLLGDRVATWLHRRGFVECPACSRRRALLNALDAGARRLLARLALYRRRR